MDKRLQSLQQWLHTLPSTLGLQTDSLRPASDDASFRRYFRIDAEGHGATTRIVMDAPPPMEDIRPFLSVGAFMARAGVRVPECIASDAAQGFVLLEDFGSVTYLDALNAERAPGLYTEASETLIRLQCAQGTEGLPPYDRERLLRELELFPEWYVATHRGRRLSEAERQTLSEVFDRLLSNILAQPQVPVHRDYHSRNLMVLTDGAAPGVLDFQDAVVGPLTYDLVSLLKDAYIEWEEPAVLDWAIRHWERARAAGLPVPAEFGDFYRDFEWMGLQRHLKVLGIFARLHHRDGKPRYLQDLPRVLEHVRRVSRRYSAFSPLAHLLDRIEGDAPGVGLTF